MFLTPFSKTSMQAFCEYLPDGVMNRDGKIYVIFSRPHTHKDLISVVWVDMPAEPNWWLVPSNEVVDAPGEKYHFDMLGTFFRKRPAVPDAYPFFDDRMRPDKICETFNASELKKISTNILFEMLELSTLSNVFEGFSKLYMDDIVVPELVTGTDRCLICGTPFTYKTIQTRSGDEPSIDVVVCDNGHSKPSAEKKESVPVYTQVTVPDESLPQWYRTAIAQL